MPWCGYTTFCSEQSQPKPLFSYFKQMFAQVTNPPIDAIREKLPTSTTVLYRTDGNLLEEEAENCKMVQNPQSDSDERHRSAEDQIHEYRRNSKWQLIPITYYVNTPLERALDHLFVEVDRAYRDGVNILILSDRGIDENHMAIPSLQQHLPLSIILSEQREQRFAVILEVQSQEKCIILQRCWVMVPAPSTHIWLRRSVKN